MSVESISSSVVCSAPDIGSSLGSSVSFAPSSSFGNFPSFETSGLSGGSFNPSIDVFNSIPIDLTPIPSGIQNSLADINLDPSVADVAEIVEKTNSLEPEIVNNEPESTDFRLPTTAEEITEEVQELTAQTSVIPSEVEEQVLESTEIVEDCFVADVPRNDMVEELLNINSNEINEPALIEAVSELEKLDEAILDKVPTSVIPSEVEKLVEEIQEISTQTSVIPATEPESKSDSSQASLIQIKDGSRIQSGVTVNDEEISESVLEEAVNELAILTEMPIAITLPEASAEIAIIPEVILSEQLTVSEVTQIIQNNPETIQATKTYQAFVTAGVEEAQAVELVKDALVQTGTKAEVVEQIMVLVQMEQQVKTEQQVKPEIKTAQAEAKVSTQAIKMEKKIEEIMEEEEEEKKKPKKPKKFEYKFVVDENALKERYSALKAAVSKAFKKLKDGKIIVDSHKAVANLPTEPEKHTVKSEILPKYEIDLFGFENGDGSYREAIKYIIGLINLDPNSFLQKGSEIFRNLPPVKIALTGKVVKEIDVKRVRSFQPDSIRLYRNQVTYS